MKRGVLFIINFVDEEIHSSLNDIRNLLKNKMEFLHLTTMVISYDYESNWREMGSL